MLATAIFDFSVFCGCLALKSIDTDLLTLVGGVTGASSIEIDFRMADSI